MDKQLFHNAQKLVRNYQTDKLKKESPAEFKDKSQEEKKDGLTNTNFQHLSTGRNWRKGQSQSIKNDSNINRKKLEEFRKQSYYGK